MAVVALYACFLLVERNHLDAKIASIARSPQHAQRIKEVISDINARVGAYLALKTFLGVLLGTIMRAKGYDVRVYIEDIQPPDMQEVLSADLVAISAITSTAPQSYRLADQVRAAGWATRLR